MASFHALTAKFVAVALLALLLLPQGAGPPVAGALLAAPILFLAVYSVAAAAYESPVRLHGSTVTYVRGVNMWRALRMAHHAHRGHMPDPPTTGALILASHDFNHIDSFALFTEMERATAEAAHVGGARPAFSLLGSRFWSNRAMFGHYWATRGGRANVRMAYTLAQGEGTVAMLAEELRRGRNVIMLLARDKVDKTGPYRVALASRAPVITLRLGLEPGTREIQSFMAHLRADYEVVGEEALAGGPHAFMDAIFTRLYPTPSPHHEVPRAANG